MDLKKPYLIDITQIFKFYKIKQYNSLAKSGNYNYKLEIYKNTQGDQGHTRLYKITQDHSYTHISTYELKRTYKVTYGHIWIHKYNTNKKQLNGIKKSNMRQ